MLNLRYPRGSRNLHSSMLIAALVAALYLTTASPLHAGCNLIPSATQNFRGTLGATNKPYAAPGDFVEVGLQPAHCDATSSGLGALPTDQNVTVVFTPPLNGTRRVAFLTADPAGCAGVVAQTKQAACEAIVGAGNVQCVDGAEAALALVSRNGVPHLSFRFPDTDALFAPDGDHHTLAGPATIAVSPAAAVLPCGLASTTCATRSDLVACVDDLYAADGTCQPHLDTTFPHFTALPPPNDFQADCFLDQPPCTATAVESRAAVDSAGNMLLPVNWSGILVRQSGVPVPRLLRATIKSPVAFGQPPTIAFGSYTPEGARLPPIFEPQADATLTTLDAFTFFGSVDAAYTILRVARRHGLCTGGPTTGSACTQDPDCGAGGTCPVTCVGGNAPDAACAKDADCGGGGRCGALYDELKSLVKTGGALVLDRHADEICQEAPHQACAADAACAGVTNTCVSYAFEARTPVPLEGLAGSPDVFTFSISESVAAKNLNSDGDQSDLVLTLQDRNSGQALPIGAGGSLGRAITSIQQPPFAFPALATENRVIAFLEPEALEATSPAQAITNGDGDAFDTFLRVYRETPTGTPTAVELTGPPLFPQPLAVDAALAINGRSLAVSNGAVFFRTPEDGAVSETTVRVSVSDTGAEADNISALDTLFGTAISANGRYVIFNSVASNLVAGGTASRQVFVRDRDADGNAVLDEAGLGKETTELVSRTLAGVQGNTSSFRASISGDGRYAVFATTASNLPTGAGPSCPNGYAAPTGPCVNIVVKDRTTGALITISAENATTAGDGDSDWPTITPDGRFVAFQSTASNLVAGDTNNSCDNNGDTIATENCADVFVHDRDADGNGVFDEIGGTSMERVSLDGNGSGAQVNGLSRYGSISDDGRFVVFETPSGLVANDLGGDDVYLRDRLLHRTTLVTQNPLGTNPFGGIFPTISGDGRAIAFEATAIYVPGAPGNLSAWAYDRGTGAFEHLNRSSESTHGNPGLAGSGGIFSSDGRFVMVLSSSPNLAPGKTLNCRGGLFPDCYHWYVRDRLAGLTKRATVTNTGGEMVGEVFGGVAMSSDGRTVAFNATADNLLGAGNDTNLCDLDSIPPLDPCPDVFVRTPDHTQAAAADRSGDGDFRDTLLEVLDTNPATPTRTALCPAGDVAVADGRATFLRPESAGPTTLVKLPLCPLGTTVTGGVDLNGDLDAKDQVVHLWTNGNVQNLGLAARTLALSTTHVAAIDANGVLETYPVAGGAWASTGQSAESIQFCGSVLVFLHPVANHFEVGLYDPATSGLVLTGQAAEEIACSPTLVAFRTRESIQGNLNSTAGDADTNDDVLQTWNIADAACLAPGPHTGCLGNSGQALVPCHFDACDPRIPYRVGAHSVKFLTFECDQGGGGVTNGCAAPGGTDLSGNGYAGDIAIQVYDTITGVVTPYGTIPSDNPDNPLGGGAVDDGGGTPSDDGAVYNAIGRCIETVGPSCTSITDCSSAEFCENGTCKREQGVCRITTDCPPGVPCVTTGNSGIVPASADRDGDGVPDHIDNCVTVANGDQIDLDQDGTGDACDLAVCGNGVVSYDEQCDGLNAAACTAGCQPDCTCAPCFPACAACANTIADPKATVTVKTLKDAGQLRVKALLPLASYCSGFPAPCEPLTIQLDDGDSTPIIRQSLGALAPLGSSGKKWRFKTKALGLQQVQLTRRATGEFQIMIKTKGWFSAAAANDTDANTHVTVTVGTQCFTHPATAKLD